MPQNFIFDLPPKNGFFEGAIFQKIWYSKVRKVPAAPRTICLLCTKQSSKPL